MKGSAIADEPLNIDIDGAFQKQRYYISISGDPIGELFKPTQSWHLEASAEMVGITLNVSGQADKPLEGHVDSLGWGISQQDGSTGFELLPTISPTFEWIRLAQRVPVRIQLDSVPEGVALRVGTTGSVLVKTDSAEEQ